MTVAEYLKKNNKELSEVSVIAEKWGCSVVDYRKPDCGCLNDEVVKVVTRTTGTIIYSRK